MKLNTGKFIFIDCQTTGMRPPAGHLLEFAWAYGSAAEEPTIESHLIQLPEGQEIPKMVSEITGITDLQGAIELKEVFARFHKTVSAAGAAPFAIIHYAQFEKPYLADLYARFAAAADLPFTVLCSHQMTKKVFPNLPSQNIRGAAGFFGLAPSGLKRAGHHVTATHRIWRGVVEEVEKLGLHDLASLQDWLKAAPKKKVTRYEYKIDKLKRLDLPDSPGIYRMISKSGEVLYVGKATSLKSRVNSYFRGKKGRDLRKLEMLAQVWDLRVTGCATPLEAALMESDEIKRYNPPYNVVFKRGRRSLLFYNHDFSKASAQQTADFPHGPFRNSNWIEHLRLLFRSLHQPEFEQIFFNPIPPADARAGFELFCALKGLQLENIKSVRSLLAQGMLLLKYYGDEETESESDAVENADSDSVSDSPLTIEDIAAKFERLLRRAAAEYQRSKTLTGLLNSRITYQTLAGPRRLDFNHGILGQEKTGPAQRLPWSDLAIDDFDRMSILLSELSKYEHTIEW